MTNKLYNELETNLYNALYWNTKADAYTALQSRLFSKLYIELNRKLNETTDNNLFDELNN